MNINNLLFFDRNGESYNFSQDSNGVWNGNEYFLPISIALYDVSNIFIIEKVGDSYSFPQLEPGSNITCNWSTNNSVDSFFLFTVNKDLNNSTAPIYINKQNSIIINYSDFNQTDGLPLNLSYPLQINVCFSPVYEKIYTRTLNVFYNQSNGTSTKIASIQFYGEGEDEDERYKVWLSNFGIKFNREDALILKDYDLNEGLPDWKQINSARKQILVNRDQVYPYVGTYKGMMNIINLFGYRDVIRVKEYWKDTDPNSRYYNNFAMVDITDLMTLENINSINLVDLNGQIKKGGKFIKTEMLAIVYEFSEASTTTFDSDGLPEVEFTTGFSVDEIFYKLNRLANKLKAEILPVNVIIKDVIGEFIYFQTLTIRSWSDSTIITDLSINDQYTLVVSQPQTLAQSLKIRDIKTLYPGTNGSLFPFARFNNSNSYPYQNDQQYPISEIPNLIQAIQDYYSNILSYEFQYHGTPNPIDVGDDNSYAVGCPIVIQAFLPDIMLGEFTGSRFQDFDGTVDSINSVRYRGGIEIEWTITSPNGYAFNWRGPIPDLITIPHFLPNPGTYSIKAKIYSFQGTASITGTQITVETDEPNIEVFIKIQDKVRYQFRDLSNLTISDLGSSPLYIPFANVVNANGQAATLPTHYLDFNTYVNPFGIGGNQQSVQISNLSGNALEPISSSQNDLKVLWGTASSILGQPSLDDYGLAMIMDLYLNRLCDFNYCSDKLNGFYINLNLIEANLLTLNFLDGTYSTDYIVSAYSSPQDLADQLNSSSDPQVSQYNYSVINGNVHAQALVQDISLNRIISSLWDDGIRRYIYTFSFPVNSYSPGLVDTLNRQLSSIKKKIDEDLLYLDAPFNDIVYKTGEMTYSNTSITVPTVEEVVTFKLTCQTQFQLAPQSVIRVSSISNPNIWMEGSVFIQPDLWTLMLEVTASSASSVYFGTSGTAGTSGFFGQVEPASFFGFYGTSGTSGSIFTQTASDWQFDYATYYNGVNQSIPNAGKMDYWLNSNYCQVSTSGYSGYLPSNHSQNSFNLNNLKIGLDAAVLPLYQPIFAVVPNIPSKSNCLWTLTLNGNTVVQISSPSYFIWRFSEPGDYYLSVKVTDYRGNVYSMSNPYMIGHVKNTKDYISYIENTLNLRKNSM